MSNLKFALVALACLLGLNSFGNPEASAAPGSVEVQVVEQSSQKARIIVLFEAKPQPDVKIAVLDANGKQVRSLNTDANGVVTLPKLAPGQYCIYGAATATLRGTLCLAVAKHKPGRASEFSMALKEGPANPLTLEELLANPVKRQPTEHLPAFAGLVQDPSGSGITAATIAIYRAVGRKKERPEKIITDGRGYFRTVLPEGIYTAVFQCPGFKTEVVVVEIRGDATTKDWQVRMRLGDVS